jgi:hypothetical protein
MVTTVFLVTGRCFRTEQRFVPGGTPPRIAHTAAKALYITNSMIPQVRVDDRNSLIDMIAGNSYSAITPNSYPNPYPIHDRQQHCLHSVYVLDSRAMGPLAPTSLLHLTPHTISNILIYQRLIYQSVDRVARQQCLCDYQSVNHTLPQDNYPNW